MKKLLILLTTASFLAISCSIVDQFIWKNEFSWITISIGFTFGLALMLLSNIDHPQVNRKQLIH